MFSTLLKKNFNLFLQVSGNCLCIYEYFMLIINVLLKYFDHFHEYPLDTCHISPKYLHKVRAVKQLIYYIWLMGNVFQKVNTYSTNSLALNFSS